MTVDDLRVPRYDTFAPSTAKASRIARAIRRVDTKPEIALRRAVWALGLRYRKHAAQLRGRPDMVFPAARVVVFCDGEFWHGRNWKTRKSKLLTGSNAAYWVAKIEANIRRDKRVNASLRRNGWRVIRLWESDVLRGPDLAAARIAHLVLGHSRDRAPYGRSRL